MALSNHERVGKSMDLLKAGLAPFAEREVFSRLSSCPWTPRCSSCMCA
jgi:hypothetical protein